MKNEKRDLESWRNGEKIFKTVGRREHNKHLFKYEVNSCSCLFYFDTSCDSFIKKNFLLDPKWAVHRMRRTPTSLDLTRNIHSFFLIDFVIGCLHL